MSPGFRWFLFSCFVFSFTLLAIPKEDFEVFIESVNEGDIRPRHFTSTWKELTSAQKSAVLVELFGHIEDSDSPLRNKSIEALTLLLVGSDKSLALASKRLAKELPKKNYYPITQKLIVTKPLPDDLRKMIASSNDTTSTLIALLWARSHIANMEAAAVTDKSLGAIHSEQIANYAHAALEGLSHSKKDLTLANSVAALDLLSKTTVNRFRKDEVTRLVDRLVAKGLSPRRLLRDEVAFFVSPELRGLFALYSGNPDPKKLLVKVKDAVFQANTRKRSRLAKMLAAFGNQSVTNAQLQQWLHNGTTTERLTLYRLVLNSYQPNQRELIDGVLDEFTRSKRRVSQYETETVLRLLYKHLSHTHSAPARAYFNQNNKNAWKRDWMTEPTLERWLAQNKNSNYKIVESVLSKVFGLGHHPELSLRFAHDFLTLDDATIREKIEAMSLNDPFAEQVRERAQQRTRLGEDIRFNATFECYHEVAISPPHYYYKP